MRNYQTLLSYNRCSCIHHIKVTAIAARQAVNEDEVLLGYILSGEHNISVAKHEWEKEWTTVKQALAVFSSRNKLFRLTLNLLQLRQELKKQPKNNQFQRRSLLINGLLVPKLEKNPHQKNHEMKINILCKH